MGGQGQPWLRQSRFSPGGDSCSTLEAANGIANGGLSATISVVVTELSGDEKVLTGVSGIANGGLPATISVVVTELSGNEKVLTGVSGSSCLQDFRQQVAVEFETAPALVQLVL